jgi:hypothetical protein
VEENLGLKAHPCAKLKDTDAGQRVASLADAEICELIIEVLPRIKQLGLDMWRIEKPRSRPYQSPQGLPRHNTYRQDRRWQRLSRKKNILLHTVLLLLRRKLPFSDEQLGSLCVWLTDSTSSVFSAGSAAGVIKALEDRGDSEELPEKITVSLEKIREGLVKLSWEEEGSLKLADRVERLLNRAPEIPLEPGESWADAAIDALERMLPEERQVWLELLVHCESASGRKPSKKWRAQTGELVSTLGEKAVASKLEAWFSLVPALEPKLVTPQGHFAPIPVLFLGLRNAEALKGLLWTAAILTGDALARTISEVAKFARTKLHTRQDYNKLVYVTLGDTALMTTCLWTLGEMDDDAAFAQLVVLKARFKGARAQKTIEKAMNAFAMRKGLSLDDLDEIGVPTFGLEEGGTRRVQLEDSMLELTIAGGKPVLCFVRGDGERLKSVPKRVVSAHPDQLKELKQSKKDIATMLAAQRERLDRLFVTRKRWTFAEWRTRYLDHPLVGVLARRLIWTFGGQEEAQAGIYLEGRLVNVRGQELESISGETSVHLWHPIDADVDTIVRWRRWLDDRQVTQPFKQAHREVYLLTDAERGTATYSNRYASHFLKQHQFHALCQARGWRNTLQLRFEDEGSPAIREIPASGLRAEYWIEGAEDANDLGSRLYVSTDQVRFYPLAAAGHGQPVLLNEVPTIVFSEVMRDIDLFVGVAGVGSDPTWTDPGPDGRRRDYWHRASFGNLTETAQTRRELLEGLLPRLKIKDRCELSDRFLIVRGDLGTYKIHLGSGNVLMEPDDRYLCVVATQGRIKRADQVFLPFEGDRQMSVILSKAFLLAEDTKIKDPSILSQFQRRAAP